MKKNLNKKRITNIRKNIPIRLSPPNTSPKGKQISSGNEKLYISKNQYGSEITKSKIKNYQPENKTFTPDIKQPQVNCCNDNICNGCCECEWYPNYKNNKEIKLPSNPRIFLISVSFGKIKFGSSGE